MSIRMIDQPVDLMAESRNHLLKARSSPAPSPGTGSPLLSALAASHYRSAGLLTSVGQEQGIVSHLRKAQEHQDIETILRHKQDLEILALYRALELNQSNRIDSLLTLSPPSLRDILSHRSLLASRISLNSLLGAGAGSVCKPANSAGANSSASLSSSLGKESVCRKTTAPKGKSPKVLFMDCDEDSLSEYQCLIRQQMELFPATEEDTTCSVQGRNKQILPGQVGIRCRHCAGRRTKGSVYFPTKLDRIYQAAQNLSAFHLCEGCPYVPSNIRDRVLFLKERKSPAGGGKRYWAEGVRCLGVVEKNGGLYFES